MGDVGEFLVRISPKYANPRLMHDGPKPDHHRDVNGLAEWSRTSCYVYMFLRDGWALYIGMSGDPGRRFEVHSTKRPWFDVANEYVLIRLECPEYWQARDAARAAELAAIRMFGPTFNIAGAA
jgi:predicted GIY-YIG superfamily endonuclease